MLPARATRSSRAHTFAMVLYGLSLAERAIAEYMSPRPISRARSHCSNSDQFWMETIMEARRFDRAKRDRGVDRGVRRHHFPRRRAPPDVARSVAVGTDGAGSVIAPVAVRAVPTSCLCSQSR
jgi:hypothetical protein